MNNTNDEDEETGAEQEHKLPQKTAAQGQEVPRVVSLLSAVLERLIARNEKSSSSWRRQNSDGSNRLTQFHALKPPSISIPRYLERIFKYTSCSPSCFVVGYVYIDRLVHKHPDLPITSFNVHRLLVTSVMLAAKVLDDVHFNNAFFARVGGISTLELNRLELELLFRLDFRLSVSTQEYQSYCSYLDREVPAAAAAAGVSCFAATAAAASTITSSRVDRDRPFSFEKSNFGTSPNSSRLSSKNSTELINRKSKNASGSSSSSSSVLSNNYSSIFAMNYDIVQTPERSF